MFNTWQEVGSIIGKRGDNVKRYRESVSTVCSDRTTPMYYIRESNSIYLLQRTVLQSDSGSQTYVNARVNLDCFIKVDIAKN